MRAEGFDAARSSVTSLYGLSILGCMAYGSPRELRFTAVVEGKPATCPLDGTQVKVRGAPGDRRLRECLSNVFRYTRLPASDAPHVGMTLDVFVAVGARAPQALPPE
ncbi:hypothetical protein [Sorangium sp. So ce542]|uniref:hypothetical protein n=1 Tax=Sorangium sp. So ce542 TaxID=3133316 RepID=UPI003F62D6C9